MDKLHFFRILGIFQDQGHFQGLFKVCANPVKFQVFLKFLRQIMEFSEFPDFSCFKKEKKITFSKFPDIYP